MSDLTEKAIITILSVIITSIIGTIINMNKLGLFYAAITCVVIVNVDFEELIKNAKDRAIGTIIGGIIGVLIAYLPIPTLLTLIIGESLVMIICEKILKIPSVIASVVFLIIIFNITSEEPFIYGLDRVLETFIGIIVTVAITYLGKKAHIFK